jgi:hypothetical protein
MKIHNSKTHVNVTELAVGERITLLLPGSIITAQVTDIVERESSTEQPHTVKIDPQHIRKRRGT